MTINKINSSQVYGTNAEVQKKQVEKNRTEEKQSQTASRSDKLELSEEAKNLNAYNAKIKAGVYNKPEVIRNVSEKISQELPPVNQAV